MERVEKSVNLASLVALLRAPLADGGLALSEGQATHTKHELLRFLALKVREGAHARADGALLP